VNGLIFKTPLKRNFNYVQQGSAFITARN